jgi:hypothetical protein
MEVMITLTLTLNTQTQESRVARVRDRFSWRSLLLFSAGLPFARRDLRRSIAHGTHRTCTFNMAPCPLDSPTLAKRS